MKIDFSTPILGLDNEQVVENDEAVTLGTLAIGALLQLLPGLDGRPENLSATDKVHHAVLAQSIFQASAPIEVSVDDVSLLKTRIGQAFMPLAVMRAFEILDPPPAKS